MNLYLKPYIKINFKWIKDLSLRAINLNILEETIGINHCDFGLSKWFSGFYSKRTSTTKHVKNNLYFIKHESFCVPMNIIEESEKTHRMGENKSLVCVYINT